jgi:hypothetical protein
MKKSNMATNCDYDVKDAVSRLGEGESLKILTSNVQQSFFRPGETFTRYDLCRAAMRVFISGNVETLRLLLDNISGSDSELKAIANYAFLKPEALQLILEKFGVSKVLKAVPSCDSFFYPEMMIAYIKLGVDTSELSFSSVVNKRNIELIKTYLEYGGCIERDNLRQRRR